MFSIECLPIGHTFLEKLGTSTLQLDDSIHVLKTGKRVDIKILSAQNMSLSPHRRGMRIVIEFQAHSFGALIIKACI